MTGVIENGRTMVEPWYFGGTKIFICCGRQLLHRKCLCNDIRKCDTDWMIYSEAATLPDDSLFSAKNMQLRIGSLPVFWLPCF